MNQELSSIPKSSQSNDAIYETLTDFRKSIKQINREANPYMIFENLKKWLNLQWLNLQDSQQAEYLNNIQTDIINEQNKITDFEQQDNLDDLVINNLVSKLWKSPLTSSELDIEKQTIVNTIKATIKNHGFTQKTDNLYTLFYVILDLTKPSEDLFNNLLNLIKESKTKILFSTQEGKTYLKNLVRFNMIDNWRELALKDYFAQIENSLINNDNFFWLLVTYGYILRHSLDAKNNNKLSIPFNCDEEKQELLNLRLVIEYENNQFKIANKIYQEVFNDDWLEKTLTNLVSKDKTKNNNLLDLIKSDNLAEIVEPLNKILSNHVQSILENTIYWTDGNRDLTGKILTFIGEAIVEYESEEIKWFNKNIIFSRLLGEKYINESDFSSLISRLVLTTEGLNDKNHINKNLIRLTTKFKQNPVLIADKILSVTQDSKQIENLVDYILSSESIINEDDVDIITTDLLPINNNEELNMTPENNRPEPETAKQLMTTIVKKVKDYLEAIILYDFQEKEIAEYAYNEDLVNNDLYTKLMGGGSGGDALKESEYYGFGLRFFESFANETKSGTFNYSINVFEQRVVAIAFINIDGIQHGIFYLGKEGTPRGRLVDVCQNTVNRIKEAFVNDKDFNVI